MAKTILGVNPLHINRIPRVEVKPTRDAGEVTEGRKAALKASRNVKSLNPERDAKIEAFRKAQGWA